MTRIIDYTRKQRRMGHDYTFEPRDGGLQGKVIGWGPKNERKMEVGDVIVLTNPASRSGLSPYRITEIDYYSDPEDMFKAQVQFAPEVDA